MCEDILWVCVGSLRWCSSLQVQLPSWGVLYGARVGMGEVVFLVPGSSSLREGGSVWGTGPLVYVRWCSSWYTQGGAPGVEKPNHGGGCGSTPPALRVCL
ncbi:hypothetical protein EDB85DRAFT_2041372, partial [Lactarius pseudohatsudake]